MSEQVGAAAAGENKEIPVVDLVSVGERCDYMAYNRKVFAVKASLRLADGSIRPYTIKACRLKGLKAKLLRMVPGLKIFGATWSEYVGSDGSRHGAYSISLGQNNLL